MDFHRLNYLYNKKDKTEEEYREFQRLYHQEEHLCGLDGDRMPVEERFNEKR